MGRKNSRSKSRKNKSRKREIWKKVVFMALAVFMVSAGAAWLLLHPFLREQPDIPGYTEKAGLLKENVLTYETTEKLKLSPAGEAGNAVFISVSDGMERAMVYSGSGTTLEEAWNEADKKAGEALRKSGLQPQWVKADVVSASRRINQEQLREELLSCGEGFYRYGICFDEDYQRAFLEAELNGAGIYDYDQGNVNLDHLNTYLQRQENVTVTNLPDWCTVFQCLGWFCDEKNQIYELSGEGSSYGRRKVDLIDGEYARELILSSSKELAGRVKEDGSFVYGNYPRFDQEMEDYNMVRHASGILGLLCRYRLEPDEELAETIDGVVEYMLGQVVYDSGHRAYLYDENSDEIRLGGCGIALAALVDYMETFENEKYLEVCRSLGQGILSMLDQETGSYYHVLNRDFSRKEAFRTVFYDGEATYALCRLYGFTGEADWIYAAGSAVERFMEEEYSQYRDHWVSYSMNEITKYVVSDPYFYAFALQNAQDNLETITQDDTAGSTDMELLMAVFEVYDRMSQMGAVIDGFDQDTFLQGIYRQAERIADGYFYPECAMYMEHPQKVLNTFMVRKDGFRIRIDDIQHNISALYLYEQNYDKLVAYGMLGDGEDE